VGAEAVGEAVTHLSWLAPSAASLVALARPDAGTWPQIRSDPGAVLLVLRFSQASEFQLSLSPALIGDARVLAGALAQWDRPAAADWDDPRIQPIYCEALTYADLAARLAARTQRADPELTWVGGLLAPLGWLALAAYDASAASRLLPGIASGPVAFDQAAVARRLVRRWQLPAWLGAVAGHLALPVATAVDLGADADFFRLIQLAIALRQRKHPGLALEIPSAAAELAEPLGLSSADLDEIQPRLPEIDSANMRSRWQAPAARPLLRNLLELAAENRRLENAPLLDRLEKDLDALQRTLVQQRSTEESRLQELKLGTLAEFAAGASHEINNPLAVISGQAQYLLGHLQDFRFSIDDCRLPAASDGAGPDSAIENQKSKIESQERALKTIVGQAQRIHELLNQLMQFARPGRPQKRLIDLGGVIREVALDLAELARTRNVRLVCPEVEPYHVSADPRQLRMALACLLRNGVEAAPAEGWAGIRVVASADALEILVEDSGPGPTPQQIAHMFDPFYSGRQAGRGRGLGLPTAWRLAREHGGDVYFAEKADGPTRFVLRLPRQEQGGAALFQGFSANDTVSAAPLDRANSPLGDNAAKAG
jgi:signal transduction histidine kinase